MSQLYYYEEAVVNILNDGNYSSQSNYIMLNIWQLLVAYMNSFDGYYIDYVINHVDEVQQPDIVLNYYQIFNNDIRLKYFENVYSPMFNQSKVLMRENYMFVYLDNFWPICKQVIFQVALYIIFVAVPWIFLNLNLMSFFFISKGKYYTRIQKAFEMMFGQNLRGGCSVLFSSYFSICSFIITIMVFTDFVYLITMLISKSNFNNNSDLIQNNARVCYLSEDKFISEMLGNETQLKVLSSTTQGCMHSLLVEASDVTLISEFQLLYFLQQHPWYQQHLRYQMRLDTYKEYRLLINRDIYDWFSVSLSNAINQIFLQRLDSKVKDKHLPNQFYNNQPESIFIKYRTIQLVLIIIALLQTLVIQCTLITSFKSTPYKGHWHRQ